MSWPCTKVDFRLYIDLCTKGDFRVARTGRPKNKIGAQRLLDEAQTLPMRHPAVAKLLDMLAAEDADEVTIETALNDAIEDLREIRVRPQPQAAFANQKAKRFLSPADHLTRLSQDRRVLARLSAVIQAELAMVETDTADAITAFRNWALSQPRVDQYKLDFFTKLEAAGFDARAARKISIGDIQEFMEPFAEPITSPDDVEYPSVRPRIQQRPEVALAWQPKNPWIAVLENLKGFEYKDRPTSDRQDSLKWQRCGLPPYSSLDQYGYPKLFKEFADAASPKAQAKACWKLCETWLMANVKHDADAHAVRKNAWTLLFALRYDYASKLDIDNAVMPSPLDEAKVITVRRA